MTGYHVTLGAPYRRLKERAARAFCRVLIRQMHAMGIEVNLHVA
jgi:hypothetical protein